ncbi:MAG: VOC family protein [Propionicimonas sp.]|uniref:VOC family protein n=1 Tax=Propionicimonas sp. TaxID=1955623 RepID=UPI002B203E1E|nr:VOC family protein [Propionicimonas sp.]MEA4944913.1 VOC family protein [Propionicimonas sp.]MEA5117525.1 VOC family protein [Propionicimonas sp.]
MHVDHVTFAVGPAGLKAEAARLGELLGERLRDGGFHPRFGTRNHILPLANDRYLEVVEVLEHPAAEKAPFGQAVRARSEMGGGWLGWVVSVDDLSPYEQRLEREAVLGSRYFPDGRLLEWQQIGVKGLLADPQLPFFIHWLSNHELQPKALGGDIELVEIEIAGDRGRVEDWLGEPVDETFDGVHLNFTAPNGQPGIQSVTFKTASGLVRI